MNWAGGRKLDLLHQTCRKEFSRQRIGDSWSREKIELIRLANTGKWQLRIIRIMLCICQKVQRDASKLWTNYTFCPKFVQRLRLTSTSTCRLIGYDPNPSNKLKACHVSGVCSPLVHAPSILQRQIKVMRRPKSDPKAKDINLGNYIRTGW